jgi:hypothetical protein
MSKEVRTAYVPTCEILLVAVEVERAYDYIRVRVEDNFIEKVGLPDMNCSKAQVPNTVLDGDLLLSRRKRKTFEGYEYWTEPCDGKLKVRYYRTFET